MKSIGRVRYSCDPRAGDTRSDEGGSNVLGRQRRLFAGGMILSGLLLFIVGLGGRSGSETATASTSPTTATSTASTPASTVPATSTSSATTTTAAPTTTTTTETPVPDETVDEFTEAFAAALEVQDLEFLFDRLHPTVIDRFGEASCRSHLAAEFSPMRDYRIVGTVTGPESREVETPTGTVTLEVFDAEVAFSYLGQEFEATGTFSLVGGEMHWFATCG